MHQRSCLSRRGCYRQGKALKAYEDQLDAVFCAYLALYYWWWGAKRHRIFGNTEQGYIIAPVDERVFPRSRERSGHS
ncbi:MAG TPA: hypothetical protein VNN62_26485 [Methylomirabilota bacterium]|jgi:predicted RNase H-like nuclease|nr:hypothetical protein [Methylomirabilota bacterium]